MAVTYVLSLKTSRLNEVVTALGNSAKLEIGTSGMAATLATFTFSDPAGSVTDDVLTFTFVSSTVSADDSGTAASARLRTSADADVVTGLTVGTSGTDIVLDSTTVSSGQDITISSATITHG